MALFSGSGGDRRRRVLNDQANTTPSTAAARADANGATAPSDVHAHARGSSSQTGKSAGSIRRTRAAAAAEAPVGLAYEVGTLENQPQITALVPRRYSTIAFLFLLAATAVAGLEALHAYLPELAALTSAEHVAALALEGSGTLATWFASFALGLAAAGSLVVYCVRRHKLDDYHGRYRIWVWAALGWAALSVNTTAGLHLLAADVTIQLIGWTAAWAGTLCWLLPAVLAFGAISLRLAVEMRRCRLASTFILLAAACWIVALTGRLDYLPAASHQILTMITGGAELGGHVLLLTAIALYARHVVLDAEGQIPPRPAKKSKQPRRAKPQASTRSSSSKSAADRTGHGAGGGSRKSRKVSVDPPHATPPPPAGQWIDGSENEADAFDEDDDRSTSGKGRRLSKAERKRLRKQKTRGR